MSEFLNTAPTPPNLPYIGGTAIEAMSMSATPIEGMQEGANPTYNRPTKMGGGEDDISFSDTD